MLLDPHPQTVGFGVAAAPAEERSETAELARRLLKMDKNQDGKLTVDEVGERYRPIIARVDENKDGFATREEIEAFIRSAEAPRAGEAPARSRESGRPPAGGRQP